MGNEILGQKCKIKKIVRGNKHYFFGYHNNPQISKNGKYALALEIDFINRYPDGDDIANIILINLENNKKEKIAETKAWNWQQGCMLQWMPKDYNTKIIFNDLRKDRFVSVIFDIKTKKEKVISFPLYDISPEGRFALSMNFSRLNDLRDGYGFPGLRDKNKGRKCPPEEGVYLIDFKKNTSEQIISLEQLSKTKHLQSMKKGKHWVDQPVFSPNGKRFCFLHRWELEGGLFHTRFFTADINGKNLFMFPDSGFYSHFCWKDNNHILVWCSVSEKFRSIRKGDKKSNFLIEKILPFYRKTIPRYFRKRILPANYYLIKDQTSKIEKTNVYYEDGHPSFSPNGKHIITDTYANSKNYRALIVYDRKEKKGKILGKFYSLPKGVQNPEWSSSGLRCDLHPRWDFRGEKVTFDSVHEGKRNCYIVHIKS